MSPELGFSQTKFVIKFSESGKTRFKDLTGGYGVICGWNNSQIFQFEATTNFEYVCAMSATILRQGGRVLLEQSNMCLGLNIGKMAKGGFSCDAKEETQQLNKKSQADVQHVKMRGDEFPGHQKVKDAMERHPAMVHKTQIDGCLPCENGTEMNSDTLEAHKKRHTTTRTRLISTQKAASTGNARCPTR
jgi:hypothetical protein